MAIGLMGAFPQEVEAIRCLMENREDIELAGRTFSYGRLAGQEIVVVFSKWGKVNAATTATLLLSRFDVAKVIFTGVAGGLQSYVNVGDIIIARDCVQHDMNAEPLFPEFEIPMSGISHFKTCAHLSETAFGIATHFVSEGIHEELAVDLIEEFALQQPKVHIGTVVTGDQFVSSAQHVDRLTTKLKESLAAEMEGAAVAQVCHEFGIPFGLWRIVSDKADHTADIDFTKFAEHICPAYIRGIVPVLINQLSRS